MNIKCIDENYKFICIFPISKMNQKNRWNGFILGRNLDYCVQ